jgi:very-short-patch-repair endonuclease
MDRIDTPVRGIERRARSQHGVFTYQQAIADGMTRTMVSRRTHNGQWIRLAPEVYALPTAELTWLRQYKAAELSIRGAAISGLAAAKAHGFDDFRTVRPEIHVPYTSKTRSPIAVVHRGHAVPTVIVNGLRVTSIAQTLFDVATRVPLLRLEGAMDGALLDRKVTVDELVERRMALELSRRPGIGLWRALVEERAEEGWVPPESKLEALLWHTLLDLPGQPKVLRQVAMPWWEPNEGRVDALIPQWRTIVEADGRRWHARVKDFEADRWRDNVAQANGYRVLRFTHLHLTQRPDEVRELIVQAANWQIGAA